MWIVGPADRIVHKGWKASTEHGPLLNRGKFDQDRWQLFHTDMDRAEAHDLAAKHVVGVEFKKKSVSKNLETLGTMTLYVDERAVASGDFRTQSGHYALAGEGMAVGYDIGERLISNASDVSATSIAEIQLAEAFQRALRKSL